jgi:RNA polymerase sigma-70 factor (ECF subfamily)
LTAAELRARLYGILNNRDDAEDVAQEVFTKTYFRVKGFPARGLLYGWIHRITVNEWFQLLLIKESGSLTR